MKALDKFEPDGRRQIVTAWAPVGAKKERLTAFLEIDFQERMILPTPPLPPWKGRRTVQRSYSSEMLNTDSMLRYGNNGEITVYKPLIGPASL